MNQAVAGAVGGFAATVPMTLVMEGIWEHLPRQEQQPVYPSIITERILGAAGIEQHLNDDQHRTAALFSHFGYGASMGACYGILGRHLPLPVTVRGIMYGLAIYAISYHGYLPALRILRPIAQHSPGRRASLIAAHAVWGLATALITEGIGRTDAKKTPGRKPWHRIDSLRSSEF